MADLGDGLGVAFKLWGEDTGASIAVVEHPFALRPDPAVLVIARAGCCTQDLPVAARPREG